MMNYWKSEAMVEESGLPANSIMLLPPLIDSYSVIISNSNKTKLNEHCLARNVIISFVIFNKETLNLFNLDIGSVLSLFFLFLIS